MKNYLNAMFAFGLSLVGAANVSEAQSILVGGDSHDLFVYCSAQSGRCFGTQERDKATQFDAIRSIAVPAEDDSAWPPFVQTSKQLRDRDSGLCLNVVEGTRQLSLYPCSRKPADTEIFLDEADGVRSVRGGSISWTGDGEPLEVVGEATDGWKTSWRFEGL